MPDSIMHGYVYMTIFCKMEMLNYTLMIFFLFKQIQFYACFILSICVTNSILACVKQTSIKLYMTQGLFLSNLTIVHYLDATS